MDEMFTDLTGHDRELMPIVIAELDGQVRRCDQQCEFVRGGEVAFSEKALQLGEERELFLRRWWPRSGHTRFDQ